MNISPRQYLDGTVDFEKLSKESYCGNLSYRARDVLAKVSSKSIPYSSAQIKDKYIKYKTTPYPTPEEVFIHVMGWVDCMLHFWRCDDIPNDNEDSYKKEYEKLLKTLENRCFENDIKKSQTSKVKWESAYQEGWKSKLDELNNMEIINPE